MAPRPQRQAAQSPELSINAELMDRDDVRARAEMLVLQQIRDSLVSLTTSVQDVRDRVIKMESFNAEKKIEDLETDLRHSNDRLRNVELQNAQWKGTFIPLTLVGTLIVSSTVAFVMAKVFA